jgi:hypothetical protein
LKAKQQDARRSFTQVKFTAGAAERVSECAVHDSNKSIAHPEATDNVFGRRTSTHCSNKLISDLNVDVGIEKCTAYLSKTRL